MADLAKTCSVENCNRPGYCRSFCSMHYNRWRKHGDPQKGAMVRGRQQWIERNADHKCDDCLPWPYAVAPHGRGVLNFRGADMSAPKAMCIAAHGLPPTEHHEAAHSCGKGHEGCLNPRHISWKTRSENEADKVLHGTLRKGTDINTNVLTEDQVRAIRLDNRRTPGVVLAKRFGVTPAAISAVRTRKTWAWLA